MLNISKSLILAATTLFLASCVSNGDTSKVNVNGQYNIQATSTTNLDINGDTCGDASGTMLINEYQISGSGRSSNGFSLDLQGSITRSGYITGGFARGGNIVTTFTGSFTEASGSGTWRDDFRCTGTWSAYRTTRGN